MFGLAKREREALNSLIETQREEIHWLRSCIPWAVPAGVPAPLGARIVDDYAGDLKKLAEDDGRLYMTEEEEDLQFLLDSGEINLQEMKELLEAAGARSTEIEVIPGD